MCECGGQSSTLGVFLNYAPLYFLRQVLSLNPEFTDLDRLGDCQDVHISILLASRWTHGAMPRFLHECWRAEVRPHACAANTLWTVHLFRPYSYFSCMFLQQLLKEGRPERGNCTAITSLLPGMLIKTNQVHGVTLVLIYTCLYAPLSGLNCNMVGLHPTQDHTSIQKVFSELCSGQP